MNDANEKPSLPRVKDSERYGFKDVMDFCKKRPETPSPEWLCRKRPRGWGENNRTPECDDK